MACKLESCAECTQKCLLIHGRKRNSSPVITSFFKVMIGKQFSEVLVWLLCNSFNKLLYMFALFRFPFCIYKGCNLTVSLTIVLAW